MVQETALILAGLGSIVWAVRQEGRVNTHDQMFKDRDDWEAEFRQDNKERLIRIERKLDKLKPGDTGDN